MRELQKAIVRNKKEVTCQVNELNIGITQNLTTNNQLQNNMNQVQ